jgi:hypothetical protein
MPINAFCRTRNCILKPVFVTVALVLAVDCVYSNPIELVATDTSDSDAFGHSVAIWGDVAVVGARHDDSNFNSAGNAYVFERTPTGAWIETALFPTHNSSDRVGSAVAIHEDTVLVTAPYRTIANDGDGLVYEFRRQALGDWQATSTFRPIPNDKAQGLGEQIALWGNVAAVSNPNSGGEVYLFERNSLGAWQELDRITSPSAAAVRFGRSIALHGDLLVIGDSWDSSERGAAFVYQRSGNSWDLVTTLSGSDVSVDDLFGESVSIHDDVIIVGSPDDGFSGNRRGSAYVFERASNGSWAQTARLHASSWAATSLDFGHGVAVHDNRIVVGDPNDRRGAAYFYERNVSGWVLVGRHAQQSDVAEFGSEIALGEQRLVIGANDYSDSSFDSGGRAYVLQYPEHLPGDYNFDGLVNAADYTAWKASFGSTMRLEADGNANQIVDAADYTIWRDNLGRTFNGSAGSVQSIPEPCNGAMSLLFVATLSLRIRREWSGTI